MLRRGSGLGKYRLERRIGRGAFSEVWCARDTVEDVRVALKVTPPGTVAEYGRAAFEKEARMAARLSHPNIVAIRNADWIEGRFVMACELASRSLDGYSGARRSGAVALRVIRQVARGLAHAHAQKIVHRDVKPENIMIFADGRAAIGDFGLCRLAPGERTVHSGAGTLGYVAPEQAYGRPTFSSDVFSLGLISYELLAGTLPTWPFEFSSSAVRRFQERVPEPVSRVLRKAATFDPRKRFADAIAFRDALDRACAGCESSAPARRRPRRRRAAAPVSPLEAQAMAFARQHGQRLRMRYRCYRCELPIAEAMSVCPWCGFAENSFLEISPSPLVCPDCERGVEPEWTACPWCYAGRLEGNGRPPRPDPRDRAQCAGCGAGLRAFMRYCPRCKRKVARPWKDPALPDRCPRCRWSISREFWPHCPWCGRHERAAGRFRS